MKQKTARRFLRRNQVKMLSWNPPSFWRRIKECKKSLGIELTAEEYKSESISDRIFRMFSKGAL